LLIGDKPLAEHFGLARGAVPYMLHLLKRGRGAMPGSI
jgi:hypothetical protein